MNEGEVRTLSGALGAIAALSMASEGLKSVLAELGA